MADNNPLRGCDSCGKVDAAPRHVWGTDFKPDEDSTTPDDVAAVMIRNAPEEATADVLRHIRDSNTQMKHMDCCRTDGCPDGSCGEVTEGAEDKRNEALRKHIQSDETSKRLTKVAKDREKKVIAANEAAQEAALAASEKESA